MAALPVCTVCKRFKDTFDERNERERAKAKAKARAKAGLDEEEEDDNEEDMFLLLDPKSKGKPDWSPTSERLSVSHVQIVFKLFELLKREFLVGYICSECLVLLEQADSLQFQLHAVIKALKERVDSHCGDRKRTSDVLDSRQGYRTKFRKLKAKKRALIGLEAEDATKHLVRDDDLPLVDEYEPERKVFCTEPPQQPGPVKTNNSDSSSRPPSAVEDDNALLQAAASAAHQAASQEPAPAHLHLPQAPPASGVSFGVNMSFWANVNDVSYIQQTLAKKNFDAEFSIFTASTKSESMVYDGHLWKRDVSHNLYRKKTTGGILNAWWCAKKFLKTNNGRSEMRQGTGCKARLATLHDDSQVVLDSVEIEHNHEANHDELKHEVFVYKLKEIVSNDPCIEPSQAVARAEVLYGKQYQSSYKTMIKFVTDIQRRLGVTGRGSKMNMETTKADGTPVPRVQTAETKTTAVAHVAKRIRYQGELERGPNSEGLAYDTSFSHQQSSVPHQQHY